MTACRGPGKDGAEFCGATVKARGLCQTHYNQFRKGKELKPIGVFGTPPKEPYDPEKARAQREAEEAKERERQAEVDWSTIPVPQNTWHGDLCPADLGHMRDAIDLPYHPQEPAGRAAMREWRSKNLVSFTEAKLKLEAEFRQRCDKYLEEEDRKEAEKAQRAEIVDPGQEQVDLGTEKILALIDKIQKQWEMEEATASPLPAPSQSDRSTTG